MAEITIQIKLNNEYRHRDQTLLCSDLYQKVSVEISCESIQFLP